MINLPKYKNTDWYLDEVRKLFVNQRIKSITSSKQFSKNTHSINLAIYNLGITKKDFTNPGNRSLFEELLIADYKDLKKIKEKINLKGGKDLFYETIMSIDNAGQVKEIEQLKQEWKDVYTSYDKLIKRKVNNKIIEHLQVKVCPYCNESYINNRLKKVTAQMDQCHPAPMLLQKGCNLLTVHSGFSSLYPCISAPMGPFFSIPSTVTTWPQNISSSSYQAVKPPPGETVNSVMRMRRANSSSVMGSFSGARSVWSLSASHSLA